MTAWHLHVHNFNFLPILFNSFSITLAWANLNKIRMKNFKTSKPDQHLTETNFLSLSSLDHHIINKHFTKFQRYINLNYLIAEKNISHFNINIQNVCK